MDEISWARFRGNKFLSFTSCYLNERKKNLTK